MPRISLSRAPRVLICASITANAVCAGGIYTFPLISPALVAHMKLSQLQLSTIMLAAMVGQYATAVPVGKVLDRYGPRCSSLLASIMLSVGYGLFALEYSRTPERIEGASPSAFAHLVLSFGFLGVGTLFSYFALLFAATKTFPQYMGFATGTSLAIFGTSPLFLSMIVSRLFSTTSSGVDVARFFVFMAILTGTVNFLGALILPGPRTNIVLAPRPLDDPIIGSEYAEDRLVDQDERTSLLAPSVKSVANVVVVPAPEPDDLAAIDLLKEPSFWVLALIVSLVVGAAEMIKSNIGLVVLSLSTASGAQDISRQVQVIAVSDTLTRLLVGPFADVVSPVASYSSGGVWAFPRKPYITRIHFLATASLLFTTTFLWQILAARSQGALWPLSISTGIANGTIFTMLPSILTSIWGLPNQGRNFGFISYACFIGTTAFSYLYAFVADSHTSPDQGICHGVQCWRTTFWVSAAATLFSTGLCCLLWNRWKTRV